MSLFTGTHSASGKPFLHLTKNVHSNSTLEGPPIYNDTIMHSDYSFLEIVHVEEKSFTPNCYYASPLDATSIVYANDPEAFFIMLFYSHYDAKWTTSGMGAAYIKDNAFHLDTPTNGYTAENRQNGWASGVKILWIKDYTPDATSGIIIRDNKLSIGGVELISKQMLSIVPSKSLTYLPNVVDTCYEGVVVSGNVVAYASDAFSSPYWAMKSPQESNSFALINSNTSFTGSSLTLSNNSIELSRYIGSTKYSVWDTDTRSSFIAKKYILNNAPRSAALYEGAPIDGKYYYTIDVLVDNDFDALYVYLDAVSVYSGFLEAPVVTPLSFVITAADRLYGNTIFPVYGGSFLAYFACYSSSIQKVGFFLLSGDSQTVINGRIYAMKNGF
jgi:hypothetical protein